MKLLCYDDASEKLMIKFRVWQRQIGQMHQREGDKEEEYRVLFLVA